ncbi:MAG: hypothetical protein H6970_10710 [Gammaproteobacteria bacterium]|nr:hypothetical protein [Gammaproteobacteria bacterium]MCP5425523.1 hypothetical protein [Gammaproteobacteria bacterium]MCP5459357.1 hypothetical protein [Gammaproteobacteria bacterium]
MCIAGCTPREEQGEAAKKQPTTEAKKTTEPCPLQVEENLKKCDEGAAIFEKAKKANGGKDPNIVVGTPSSGFGAETDTATGTITLSKNSDPCLATQDASFELANLSRKKDFDKLDEQLATCTISRDDYIKSNERIEYENIKTALKAFDSCKDKWGCTGKTADFEWARGVKNFDDYFKNFLSNDHKEHYGKAWDSNCKK